MDEEALLKKEQNISDDFVKEAQERLARESNFGAFSWAS